MGAEEFFAKTVDEGTLYVWNRERSISFYKRFIIKLWRSKDLNSFRYSAEKKKKEKDGYFIAYFLTLNLAPVHLGGLSALSLSGM